jgi:hypothetical protein
LLGGNHEQIRRWRRRAAIEKTCRNRPDLLERARLSEEDKEFLEAASGQPPAVSRQPLAVSDQLSAVSKPGRMVADADD